MYQCFAVLSTLHYTSNYHAHTAHIQLNASFIFFCCCCYHVWGYVIFGFFLSCSAIGIKLKLIHLVCCIKHDYASHIGSGFWIFVLFAASDSVGCVNGEIRNRYTLPCVKEYANLVHNTSTTTLTTTAATKICEKPLISIYCFLKMLTV